jgi:hypothetical protein
MPARHPTVLSSQGSRSPVASSEIFICGSTVGDWPVSRVTASSLSLLSHHGLLPVADGLGLLRIARLWSSQNAKPSTSSPPRPRQLSAPSVFNFLHPGDGWVMSPHEFHLLSSFVYWSFVNCLLKWFFFLQCWFAFYEHILIVQNNGSIMTFPYTCIVYFHNVPPFAVFFLLCWLIFFFFLWYWGLNSGPTPWATPPARAFLILM